jgi:uncharacterized protein YuzE
MRVTYDPSVDMAYIYLTHIPAGGVATTEPLIIDLPSGRRLINLDFDGDGRLLGIEIDGATSTLTKDVLSDARRL